jgi:hypothetical protein
MLLHAFMRNLKELASLSRRAVITPSTNGAAVMASYGNRPYRHLVRVVPLRAIRCYPMHFHYDYTSGEIRKSSVLNARGRTAARQCVQSPFCVSWLRVLSSRGRGRQFLLPTSRPT